jgi:hypothetical protein
MVLSVALLLGAATSWAAGPRVVGVVPAALPDARTEAVRAALTAHGYPDVVLITETDFAAAAQLVRVVGLPDADECERRVALDDWRRRFEAARGRFRMLAFGDALAALVALDVELVCLATPPATSDLFRLELGLAEANTFLAQAASRDPSRRRFHEEEAARALQRAARFGAALSAPADLSPEVLLAYDAARRGTAEADPPRVVVTGPGARVGARFNGRPLPDIPFDGVDGVNLVQAADGATVTAAARVRLTERRTLVWLAPEGSGPASVGAALTAFVEHRADAEDIGLLAAAGRLVGDGATVLFVEAQGPSVRVWAGEGDTLVEVPAAPRAPTDDAWRFVLGAGPSAGWSSIGGGALEGLGGLNAGFSVHGRVGVTPWLALALTVDPWAVAAPIALEDGSGTLFRATVPSRFGVRFGKRTRAIAVEGGVEAGVHWFGVFDEHGAAVPRMSFLAAGAVGVSGAIGPRAALRAQGWFGGGLGYVSGGAMVGLEARL